MRYGEDVVADVKTDIVRFDHLWSVAISYAMDGVLAMMLDLWQGWASMTIVMGVSIC